MCKIYTAFQIFFANLGDTLLNFIHVASKCDRTIYQLSQSVLQYILPYTERSVCVSSYDTYWFRMTIIFAFISFPQEIYMYLQIQSQFMFTYKNR